MSSSIFFFVCYAVHRYLHSFPTRRSSDLTFRNPSVLKLKLRSTRMSTSGPVPSRNAADRKSTRLNSSHRCISYAVFCLKKKIDQRGPKLTRSSRPGKIIDVESQFHKAIHT